jgi:hypothetical protein
MIRSNRFLNTFYGPLSSFDKLSNKNISIVVYVIIAMMVVDTILNQNEEVRAYFKAHGYDLGLFVLLAAVAIVGQYYVLRYVKDKSESIRSKAGYLFFSHKVTTVLQYLVIADFVAVVFGVVILSLYATVSLVVITAVTYGLNIGLMGIFTYIFFSWYKSNRNSIVVLLYGLSFAVLVLISFVFLTGSMYRFSDKPAYILPDSEFPITKPKPESPLYLLNKIYHYSDIISFGLKWIATAFLLYHYSQKMGRTKYWVLISLPLIYFLGTYLDDFNLYVPHTENEEFYWTLYVTYNSTAGGILFYIGFVVATKHFHNNWAIKDYLIICGFGFLLFFSAGQTTLSFSPYPPFGFATMSFYGLSTYLILLGLYASAISVSQDIELRKSIKKSTLRESKFLDSMGTAHMEKELMNRMVLKAREEQNELTQESGGVRSSLNEEDILNIVKEVEMDVKENKNSK